VSGWAMEDNMEKRGFGLGECVVVNGKAPGGYVGKFGTVREIVLGSRYGISFNNHGEPIAYLDSECLDPAPKVRSK